MTSNQLLKLLLRSEVYIQMVNNDAHCSYDNPDDEYYQDSVQYEIMENSEKLLSEIGEIKKTLCEAPDCTRMKRNPFTGTYCNKHRLQIQIHGRLKPDLER